MAEETSGSFETGAAARAEARARLLTDPFRPQPVQRPQRRRWEGDVPDMAKLFLGEQKWDPNRRRYFPYWADQVEEANRRGQPWAEQWMMPIQVASWLRVWPEAKPDVAAAFGRAGISPELAMTSIWYGQVRAGRPSLAVRVAMGDLTVEEAVAQLTSVGLLPTEPVVGVDPE